jgi:tetratricopeptide (TPR) repeat protein
VINKPNGKSRFNVVTIFIQPPLHRFWLRYHDRKTARVMKAAASFSLRRLQGFLSHWRRLCLRNFKLGGTLLTMGLFTFFGYSKPKGSSESPKLVQRAIDLSDEGNYDGAIKLLTEAITADPLNAQAYFERGMALLGLLRDSNAVKDFDHALTINPGFPGARDWRSRAAESLGDHKSAAEDRWKDLQAQPDGPHKGMGVSPQQWADCARSFVNAGNSLRAKEILENYFANYAGKVTHYAVYETAPMRMLADLLIQSGDFTRATEFAGKAYESKHKCPADVMAYAQALEASGDIVNARRICAEAMKWNDQMPGLRELTRIFHKFLRRTGVLAR